VHRYDSHYFTCGYDSGKFFLENVSDPEDWQLNFSGVSSMGDSHKKMEIHVVPNHPLVRMSDLRSPASSLDDWECPQSRLWAISMGISRYGDWSWHCAPTNVNFVHTAKHILHQWVLRMITQTIRRLTFWAALMIRRLWKSREESEFGSSRRHLEFLIRVFMESGILYLLTSIAHFGIWLSYDNYAIHVISSIVRPSEAWVNPFQSQLNINLVSPSIRR
jgi:hypothetical protein